MDRLSIMREFKTKHFTVRAEALEEYDLDLSFDEDGSIRKDLDSGRLIAFCAHVAVYYKGLKVGEDYLGNCIYESVDDFMDHRICGKQNREWINQGITSRCGSYFSDMIHEAISEARNTLCDRPYIRNPKKGKPACT